MAIVITNDKHYTNIANAIREKNGETTTYKPEEMAAAIEAITSGNPITEMNVYELAGMYTIKHKDGTVVNGSVTFDEDGNAIALTDDAGNSVTFVYGYPVSARDAEGNSVTVYWG